MRTIEEIAADAINLLLDLIDFGCLLDEEEKQINDLVNDFNIWRQCNEIGE